MPDGYIPDSTSSSTDRLAVVSFRFVSRWKRKRNETRVVETETKRQHFIGNGNGTETKRKRNGNETETVQGKNNRKYSVSHTFMR